MKSAPRKTVTTWPSLAPMTALQMTGLLVVDPSGVYLEDLGLGDGEAKPRDLEKALGRNDFLSRKVELRVVPIPYPAEMEELVQHEIKRSTSAPTRVIGVMLQGPADGKLWIGAKTLGAHLLRHNGTHASVSVSITGVLLGEEIPIIRF